MALLFQVLHFRVTGGGYAQAQKIPVKMCKLLKTIPRNNRLQIYITFSVIRKYPRAESKPRQNKRGIDSDVNHQVMIFVWHNFNALGIGYQGVCGDYSTTWW